ncbi:hypothetical protein G7059_01655 [Erysipelothrix sp. HDW6A]|uniref:ERF family protein n=1 Tax=Erysipelothrix sp. HDW6A TaxID=2714928 RepID=UPI00140D728C|nr:ERF family protein [Erysipelothrix sp. HDW6A]QIK56640.1 hypothetical protein G7059_01655 [Erysipelothrix sp. HDW6A]
MTDNKQIVSIYEKLQNARVQLNKEKLKKSGKNKFAGYEYFELSDFMPKSDELLLQNRLTPVFNFVDNLATLVLHDWDSESTIEFKTNGADATTFNRDGKPSNLEIQTLGSQHTYLKRYLYMHLMDVAENDGLEIQTKNPEHQPKEQTKKHPSKEMITKDQTTQILELFGERVEGLLDFCKVEKLQDLTNAVAQQLIDKELATRNKKGQSSSEPKQQSISDL